MAREIVRCSTCTHECDEIYRRSAIELLFLEEHVPRDAVEDKKQLLILHMRIVGKCALSNEQIDDNIEGVVEGTRDING